MIFRKKFVQKSLIEEIPPTKINKIFCDFEFVHEISRESSKYFGWLFVFVDLPN